MEAHAALIEIEAIKQLKARYCRLLDTKRWDEWRQLFTDDFVGDTSQAGGTRINGADPFVAYVRGNLGRSSRLTVHQVHAPEIVLQSTCRARGIWALQDVVHLAPGLDMTGYGHYHETYSKQEGCWQIATSTLTRVREDVGNGLFAFRVSPAVRNLVARRVSGRVATHAHLGPQSEEGTAWKLLRPR